MRSDMLLGIGLILFASVGIYLTLQMNYRAFTNDPGPQLFPMIGFGILILSGLGIIFGALKGGHLSTEPDAPESFLRGTTVVVMMLLYAIGLWLAGFLIATLVALYAFYHLIAGPERRVVWRGALYSAAVTAGIYVTFVIFLDAFLPQGALF